MSSPSKPASFASRFAAAADAQSPFCIGLDPAVGSLEAARLADDVAGLRTFCETIIRAAAGLAPVVKPQLAYFERFGPDGFRELRRAMDLAHELGLLVLLDGKRGDIGDTCAGYAQCYFGARSPFRADAVTVHPYLGFNALTPMLDAAAEDGAAVIVVTMSSNPEGRALQNARLESGLTIAEDLCDKIASYNAQHGEKVAGAVLGATIGDSLRPLVERLDGALVLSPGIGAQGATFEQLGDAFGAARASLVPIMARGILAGGFSHNAIRNSIADAAQKAIRFRKGEI